MAISFVSAASAAANTVAMPTHQVGDLILVWTFRDGNTTAPSLVAGFTNINNTGANTCSARLAFRIARTNSETTGTWTNATGIAIAVYRGVGAIGSTVSATGASSNSLNFTAITFDRGDNTSWVARFAGHRTATNVGANAPSSMTNRTAIATEVAAWDTNGTVTSLGSGTASVNATSGYRTIGVELIANQPISNLTDDFSSGSTVDSNKWENWGGGNVTVSGGTARINTGTAVDSYFGWESKSFLPYSLIGDQASIKMPDIDTPAANLTIYPIQLELDDTNQVYWYITNGSAAGYKVVNGSYTLVGTPITHTNGNYYRIREASGTTYWEYSTDGSSWTTLHSESNPIPLTAVKVVIFTGISGGSITPARVVQFDDFNILPSGSTTPTVTTAAVSSITDTTATGNGNVTSDGGSTITERGVVYNTTGTPTTSDSKATASGTTGSFTAGMTSLTPSTHYYVRAYAINANGTSYGSEVEFDTDASTPVFNKGAAFLAFFE